MALQPGTRVAAIADGVSSSIFSRPWAEVLVHAAEGLPKPNDPTGLVRWLRERPETWSRAIDVGDLKWFQKAKLARGAFSTLLFVHVSPRDPSASRCPSARADPACEAWPLVTVASFTCGART